MNSQLEDEIKECLLRQHLKFVSLSSEGDKVNLKVKAEISESDFNTSLLDLLKKYDRFDLFNTNKTKIVEVKINKSKLEKCTPCAINKMCLIVKCKIMCDYLMNNFNIDFDPKTYEILIFTGFNKYLLELIEDHLTNIDETLKIDNSVMLNLDSFSKREEKNKKIKELLNN
jgi:hypothetical protein